MNSLQEEEVTALSAIYGDDFHGIEGGEPPGCSFSIRIGSSGGDERHNTKLMIWLPSDYPTQAPPIYELKGDWRSSEDDKIIDDKFKEIFKCNEVVIYEWVEWLREYLDGKGSSNKSDQELLTDREREGDAILEEHQTNEESGVSPVTTPTTTPTVTPTVTTEGLAVTRDQQRWPLPSVEIVHGEPLTDRKSTFQAHAAAVASVEEVKGMLAELKTNKKIASATHNILAYRIVGMAGVLQQDCDDDGEAAAGGRLLHLLQIMDAKNVAVVVTRWYGGILLHADRFKHINNVARILMQESGIGLPAATQGTQATKTKSKKHRTKSKN